MISPRFWYLVASVLDLAPSWASRLMPRLKTQNKHLAQNRAQIKGKSKLSWEIPTVDDWFELTLRYPDFQRVSNTVLKDYGYMKIFAFLDAEGDRNRILEFGHGFSPLLFERYCERRDLWGLDCCGAPYFTQDRDEWEDLFKRTMGEKVIAQSTFSRGLLGRKNECDLPEKSLTLCVPFQY